MAKRRQAGHLALASVPLAPHGKTGYSTRSSESTSVPRKGSIMRPRFLTVYLAVAALLLVALSQPAAAQAPAEQVAVDVRLVSVCENFYDMIDRYFGIKLDRTAVEHPIPGSLTYLDDQQLFKLLEAAQ